MLLTGIANYGFFGWFLRPWYWTFPQAPISLRHVWISSHGHDCSDPTVLSARDKSWANRKSLRATTSDVSNPLYSFCLYCYASASMKLVPWKSISFYRQESCCWRFLLQVKWQKKKSGFLLLWVNIITYAIVHNAKERDNTLNGCDAVSFGIELTHWCDTCFSVKLCERQHNRRLVLYLLLLRFRKLFWLCVCVCTPPQVFRNSSISNIEKEICWFDKSRKKGEPDFYINKSK